MEQMYEYIVFILRGEPITVAHKAIADFALAHGNKVIVLFGSQNRPMTPKNPFPASTRIALMNAIYTGTPEHERMIISSIRDRCHNEDYIGDAWEHVNELIIRDGGDPKTAKVAITGYCKEGDPSAFYIQLFSMWDYIPSPAFPLLDGEIEVRATTVRSIMFSDTLFAEMFTELSQMLPKPVLDYVVEYRNTDDYRRMKAEYDGVRNFQKKLPNFTIQCNTTDALLIYKDHVLLIERGRDVGKGLLALPGGFVEANLRVHENLYKELREETCIFDENPHITEELLEKCFLGYYIEDDPHRSERCRIMTHVGVFVLDLAGDEIMDFPKVKGADDAAKAMWVHAYLLKLDMFFEDHGYLLKRAGEKLNVSVLRSLII